MSQKLETLNNKSISSLNEPRKKTTESPPVASSGGGEGADMCHGRIPRTEEDIQNRV